MNYRIGLACLVVICIVAALYQLPPASSTNKTRSSTPQEQPSITSSIAPDVVPEIIIIIKSKFSRPGPIRSFLDQVYGYNKSTASSSSSTWGGSDDYLFQNVETEKRMLELNCGLGFLNGIAEIDKCFDAPALVKRWLGKLREAGKLAERQTKPFTIVEVGVNKGLSLGGLLGALNVKNVSAERAGIAALNFGMRENRIPSRGLRQSLVGACCDAVEEKKIASHIKLPSSPSSTSANINSNDSIPIENIRIVGFDAMKTHTDFVASFLFDAVPQLRDAESNNNSSSSSSSSRHARARIIHAAVSARRGHAEFPNPPYFGSEHFSLYGGNDTPKTTVNLTTLDHELDSDYVDYLDLLLIDAEGADLNILAGSQNHILSGRVGLLVFELGFHRPQYPKLSSAIQALDTAGYSCFFPLALNPGAVRRFRRKIARRFVPLSGACWRDAYDNAKGWHNVVCVNRKTEPELLSALVSLDRDGTSSKSRNELCDASYIDRHFVRPNKREVGAAWQWAQYARAPAVARAKVNNTAIAKQQFRV